MISVIRGAGGGQGDLSPVVVILNDNFSVRIHLLQLADHFLDFHAAGLPSITRVISLLRTESGLQQQLI